MRLNINLASQPYQDVRRFFLRWGALTAVLALCSLVLLTYTAGSYRRSRDVSEQINLLREETRQLRQQHDNAVALLNLPENHNTVEASQFFNQVIAQKSFSWTQVFMQLEQVMPPRLHVVAVTPELDKARILSLHLIVAGNNRERAVELVQRMETSPAFQHAELMSELAIDPEHGPAGAGGMAGPGDTVRFEIKARYVPQGFSYSAAENDEPAKQKGSAQVVPVNGGRRK